MKQIIFNPENNSLSTVENGQAIVDSGFWYTLTPDVLGTSNGSLSANNLRFALIDVRKVNVINAVGLNISTAATGGLAKIGLYTNGSDNKPLNLITTFGELALDVTGQSFIDIPATYTINPGFYWLAIVNSLSFACPLITSVNYLYSLGATSVTASPIVGYRVTHTYADPLPSVATSPVNEFSAAFMLFRKP